MLNSDLIATRSGNGNGTNRLSMMVENFKFSRTSRQPLQALSAFDSRSIVYLPLHIYMPIEITPSSEPIDVVNSVSNPWSNAIIDILQRGEAHLGAKTSTAVHPLSAFDHMSTDTNLSLSRPLTFLLSTPYLSHTPIGEGCG